MPPEELPDDGFREASRASLRAQLLKDCAAPRWSGGAWQGPKLLETLSRIELVAWRSQFPELSHLFASDFKYINT